MKIEGTACAILVALWAGLLSPRAFSQEKKAAPPPVKAPAKAEAQAERKPAESLADLVAAARAALAEVEKEGKPDRLPAVEAEWAGKLEKGLAARPGDPEEGRALPFLVALLGGAPDGAARIRALYDRVKERAGGAPWFEPFLREIHYQLHGVDPKTLLEILADAEGRAKDPACRAAALFHRGLVLWETGKPAEARALFDRVVKETAAASYAAAARACLQEMDRLRPGLPAPEVKLPGLSGPGVDLAALKGKVTVLFFWTSRCPLLPERAAALKEIAARHKADPFAVAGVCLDPAPEKARAVRTAAELGMTWPNGFDGKGIEGPAARAYGMAFLPRTLLLDAQGRILVPDLFLHGNAGFLVNDAVTKLKAAIQKAAAAKKKAEEAKKKAAAPPKKPPPKK